MFGVIKQLEMKSCCWDIAVLGILFCSLYAVSFWCCAIRCRRQVTGRLMAVLRGYNTTPHTVGPRSRAHVEL
jgi:hypothetical protein